MESSGSTCCFPWDCLWISLAFLVVKVTTQSMSADMCHDNTRAISSWSTKARWAIWIATSHLLHLLVIHYTLPVIYYTMVIYNIHYTASHSLHSHSLITSIHYSQLYMTWTLQLHYHSWHTSSRSAHTQSFMTPTSIITYLNCQHVIPNIIPAMTSGGHCWNPVQTGVTLWFSSDKDCWNLVPLLNIHRTVKPVLTEHCHERPPVFKDHIFLA